MAKSKLRLVLGPKTEPQASFGVDLASVWGDSGGLRAGLEGSGGVRGGPRENFQIIDFLKIGVPCAARKHEFGGLVSNQK